MSVRWSSPTDRFAAVVSETTSTSLRAILYSFEATPAKMNAFAFRLKPGVYELRTGPDTDYDWKMDSAANSTQVTIAHRGDGFSFDLQPGRQTVVKLRLETALPVPDGPLPDLAVTSRDIKLIGDTLTVTVHNIGSADTGAFTVKVVDDRTRRVVSGSRFSGLRCPSDLVGKTVQARLKVPGEHGKLRVSVDYPGTEIARPNNSVLISR